MLQKKYHDQTWTIIYHTTMASCLLKKYILKAGLRSSKLRV